MKRFCLVVILSILLVALALLIQVGPGVAQEAPLHTPRPTPTPILPLPPYEPPDSAGSPEVPNLPDLVVTSIQVISLQPTLNEPTLIRVTIHNKSLI